MISIKPARYVVKVFCYEDGGSPYLEWMTSLDGPTHARITLRIARFEDGQFGDYKVVHGSILEARFFFGAGYRVYFTIQKTEIVLLLIGGTKSTQANDIKRANKLLKLYLEK